MAKRRGLFGQLIDSVSKQINNLNKAVTGLFGGGKPEKEPPKKPATEQPPRKKQDKRSVVDLPDASRTGELPPQIQIEPEPVLRDKLDHKANRELANDYGYKYIKQEYSKTEKELRRHGHETFESALEYAKGIPLPPSGVKIAFDPSSKKLPYFVIVDWESP